VGINFESTVAGGNGPAFNTGTSRMGETSTTAADPKVAAKETAGTSTKTSGSGGGGVREQRTASNIPTQNSVFVKPRRAKPSKPPYPSTLKAQGLEGDVQVRVSLDTSGKVIQVTILKSSGQEAFDEAARKAALAESFTPATRDGTAVPFTLSYSYRFRIEEN
jgi:protein TonB